MSERTVSSVPAGPQYEYAALMRPTYVRPSGQRPSTIRSRGNESIEIVFVVGSARSSMTVSERDGRVAVAGAVVVPDQEGVGGLTGDRVVQALRGPGRLHRRGAKACAFSSV